jgi:hypothetical protein
MAAMALVSFFIVDKIEFNGTKIVKNREETKNYRFLPPFFLNIIRIFHRFRNCFDFSRKDAESVHVHQTAVSVGPAGRVTMTYLSDAESVAQHNSGALFQSAIHDYHMYRGSF